MTPSPIPSVLTAARGFTLVEVLGALALCVLLAGVAATATIQSSRALRRAETLRDQTLRLRTLHVQARLRPAETATEAPPSPWRLDRDELLVPPPPPSRAASRLSDRPPLPPPPRRWTLLTLRDASSALRPVQLAILETEEP